MIIPKARNIREEAEMEMRGHMIDHVVDAHIRKHPDPPLQLDPIRAERVQEVDEEN